MYLDFKQTTAALLDKRKITLIVFLLISAAIVTYAIVITATFPKWLVDDSFIIFRYSENLARSGELNWNIGENPTEGYTGVALPVLIAIAIKLGISPVLATHILGVFFFFCGGLMLLLLLRGFNLGSTVALALYFTAPFMFTHAWSGLETTMFTTAILFAVYAAISRRRLLFSFAILLLSFTRPEGVLLSIILLILYRPVSLKTVLLYIIPCTLYFVWRWAYYGQLLPNTFYAKSLLGKIDSKNVQTLRKFFTTYLPQPALLALIFITWDSFKKYKYLIAGISAFAFITLFNYLCSFLIMNYSYRFFVPFYPLALLAIGGIIQSAKINVKVILLAALLTVPQVNRNVRRMDPERDYSSTHYKMLQDEHIKIGRFLRHAISPDEWLIVHADAGSIPYYSGLKTVDFGRLNDEYLARNDPDVDEAADYFYSFNAGVLVFTSYKYDRIDHGPEARKITGDDRFNRYTLVNKYKSRARSRYFEFLYVRNDLLDSDEISSLYQHFLVSKGAAEKKRPGMIQPLSGAGELKDAFKSGTERSGDRYKPEFYIREKLEQASKSPKLLFELAAEEKKPKWRIEFYRKLVNLYPDHEYAPQALFMIGFICAEELKDVEKARATFEELIKKYPGSDIIESAKWMIENHSKPIPEFDSTASPQGTIIEEEGYGP